MQNKSRSDVDESERPGSSEAGGTKSSERESEQSSTHRKAVSLLNSTVNPTVREAMDGNGADCQKDAIDSELQFLQQHTAWTVEKLPDGVKPLET